MRVRRIEFQRPSASTIKPSFVVTMARYVNRVLGEDISACRGYHRVCHWGQR